MVPGFADTPTALTLRQLTSVVGNTLRLCRELQQVWVTAELSDVRGSGGHCYLELVEKSDQGATVAKLRANIWNSTFRTIGEKFYKATGRAIASGIKVMICGSVTYHNVYGISFNVTDIDPTYTLGDIERLRREILDRLKAEGVAGYNKSLPLPLNPQRVAIISAAGAAGYGDFVNQLNSNPNGFVFYPHLFPAVMQGENTSPSILSALEQIEMTIDLWDCVVIIRGGGSTSDLNGFDNLDLARGVATFPLPVIVGIGHERDNTVLDYIAHTRCKTPTAVAEFLVDTLRSALTQTTTLVTDIIRYSNSRVQGEQQRVSALGSMLPALATTALRTCSVHLDNIARALPDAVRNKLLLSHSRLDSTATTLRTVANGKLRLEQQRLQDAPRRLQQAAGVCVRSQTDRLSHLAGMLKVLSPEATLQRGYSITRLNGKAIKNAAVVSDGDTISTTTAAGTIESTVISTSKQPNQK